MKTGVIKKTVSPEGTSDLNVIAPGPSSVLQIRCEPGQKLCPLAPVLDDLPTAVIIADHRGKFTAFNREAQRILGIGPLAVDSDDWSSVYGCYLRDKVTPFPPEKLPLARALRGEEVNGELIFIRNPQQRDGIWIRASSKPLRAPAGEIGSAVVVFNDVTQHRSASEHTQLLSRAVEQTADSVLITDTRGVIRYVNPAFEATTGYSAAEAVGKTPRILKSGQHDAEFYRQMWQSLLQGNAFRGTLVNRKKTGELYWAEQTITPITDDAGHISQFVSVLKDITDLRKQQEHEIQLWLARQAQQRFHAAAVPPPGLEVGRAVYPAVETGGDYIDFVPAPPKQIGIAVGDVSGHGFDSALLMALTRAYVRSYSAEGLSPAEIFARVNPMLYADLEENRYVTLVLVHLDPVENVLSYASAGHVPGFVLGPSGEVEYMMDSTGIPLGLFQEYQIENRTLALQPGSLVVLVTDGATEAGDPERGQLGLEGVIGCVRAHRTETPQQIAHAVYQCARSVAAGEPQQDDISAVVVKIK